MFIVERVYKHKIKRNIYDTFPMIENAMKYDHFLLRNNNGIFWYEGRQKDKVPA